MKTILVIEDEKDYREILLEKLKQAGYGADYAGNGEEALAKISKTTYDLILLDLVMPTMDGQTFLNHFKKLNLRTPVILLTNLNQATLPDVEYEYIVKADTTLDELLAKVKKHIDLI